MKKIIRFLAVILVVALLAGCSKADNNKETTVTMNEAETVMADQLIGLYKNANEESISSAVFNASGDVLPVLSKQLSGALNCEAQDIMVKEIDTFNNFKVYAVAVKFSDYAINDVLLIGEYNGGSYIVLQQMYTAEAQENVTSAYILHENEFEDIFTACNKQFGLTSAKKTVLSILDEENYITDENGNTIEFVGGNIKDSTLSIEGIINGVGSDINISGGLHGGENVGGNSNPDGSTDVGNGSSGSSSSGSSGESVPQTLSDGRTLVWNIEFNENNMGILASKLTTGVENMRPDRKYLFATNSLDHYFMNNGDLVLKMIKNSDGTYTTAKSVSTSGKMAYKYGYVEMRAKVPYGSYVWPGFWMKPDLNLKKSKYNGEIDIFEVFGSKNSLYFNLHKWSSSMTNSEQIGNKGNYTGNRKYTFSNSSNLNNEYHIYGFEWTKDYMKVYIDGKCYYEVSIKEEDDYTSVLPGMDCFRDYYFLCWDLMLWDYNGQGTVMAPAEYRIDYVRLYQHKGSEEIKIY